MKYIKIRPRLVREVSRYKYLDYLKDFPNGTPEKFKELTGRKPTKKEMGITKPNKNGAAEK